MTRILLIAFVLLCLFGCSHIDNAATEGKNAFETGMRTKEKAKDYGVQKEAYDRQAEDF